MRTDTAMTTEAALAAENGWTLIVWDAAYAAACDSVESEYLRGVDPDDTDAGEQARKAVEDAVTNVWQEGLSHDEWMSAALRRLRRG
jgi:hypothetical protein